jgi:hypothetical protein
LNSLNKEYLYGQPSYPVPPLSWLAPLWSFVCGVAASTAWTWTGSHLLRLLSGLLLVGPLLGIVWAASTHARWRELLRDDSPGGNAPDSVVPSESWQSTALPYTLPGSGSHRLAVWIAAASTRWRTLEPHLGKPLVQLFAGTVFSLTVAAQLGRHNLALAGGSLLVAHVGALGRVRRASHGLVSVSLPVLIAWLSGHAAFNSIHPLSAVVGLGFSVALFGCFAVYKHPERPIRGLVWQIGAQLVPIASLGIIRQPLMAAIVALLVTPQLLLIPLLQPSTSKAASIHMVTGCGQAKYFHAVQFQLMLSMFLTALALGYTL